MTRIPKPAADHGPFESREQARAAAAPVYDAVANLYGPARVGAMTPHTHKLLCSAVTAAGVSPGAYEHEVLLWVAGWGEPEMAAAVAGLIARAAHAGRDRRDR